MIVSHGHIDHAGGAKYLQDHFGARIILAEEDWDSMSRNTQSWQSPSAIKEQLVLIRPYRKGLVLHTMYHADEVRDFQQVPKGDTVKVSEKEVELGVGLIDRLTSEGFNPESYKDEYRIRVLAILDEKSKAKR